MLLHVLVYFALAASLATLAALLGQCYAVGGWR
jgi:hypothetical protein